MHERKRYADPSGEYTAGFGSPWRRAAAAAIDWTLCLVAYLIVSIPLGTLQAFGAVSWRERDFGGVPGHMLVIGAQVLTAAPAIVYFTLLLPTSQTFGMRMLDVRIVSLRTGRAPSYAAAAVRAVLTTAIAAGVYGAVSYSTSFERPRHLDTASAYALDVSYVLAAAAAASALVMLATPTHRNGFDRLFGTAVIDELEAVVPIMGPWGPLQSFDLAWKRR